MKEHQEKSEYSSPVTSEKENRTVSQGTEATQPATSLDEESEIADYGPLPSKAQMQYHREELAAFIHFGMNTYYDREWGDGQEDPYYFYPEHLDTDQWIKTLKDTGFKRTIMVVKHHDGFLSYPSKYTDHTIAKSGWKDGKGDVLAEVSASASKYDMDMGVYLSPWDAHSPLYHVDTEDQYNEYYLNQLKEILEDPKYGNKGKFVEVWMGLKKSPIPLTSGLRPFARPKGILLSSQLSPPMFVGLEMKRGLPEIRFGKRSIQIRSATIHLIATSITGIRKGSNTQWEKPMSLFAPAGSTMTTKSLSPCAN